MMDEDRRIEELEAVIRTVLLNVSDDTKNLSREILQYKIEVAAHILRAALKE